MMSKDKRWRIFQNDEGGMSDWVAETIPECAVGTAAERQDAMRWAESSETGDQFEWGCGVIVDVTGGTVS